MGCIGWFLSWVVFKVASLEVGSSVVASFVVALSVVAVMVVVCGGKLESIFFKIIY